MDTVSESPERTLRSVAVEAGRPPTSVWEICQAGLLPVRLMPRTGGGRGTTLPDAVGEDLVTVFASRVASREIARLVRADPARAVKALDALRRLAALSVPDEESAVA